MSQEKLACVLGVEQSTVYRWEHGVCTPLPIQQPKLARALGISLTELADLLGPEPDEGSSPADSGATNGRRLQAAPESTTGGSLPHERQQLPAPYQHGIAALRRVVDAYDLPEDGPVRSANELMNVTSLVVCRRLNSNYPYLAQRLPVLIPELTRALFISCGAKREQVAAMLMQLYRAADAVADKLGSHDLCARIIHVMRWAAEQSGDELALAVTSYVRTETFFTNGELETGRRMLEAAADQVRPQTSTEAAAAYGSLHMRAAIVAARAGMPERAKSHLVEARRTAVAVGEGIYHGTAFGLASVRIHEVTLALSLGAPDRALTVAGGWAPPRQLPAERRAHFYVDTALAKLLTGKSESVIHTLDEARRAAPEYVRVHPRVREILAAMPRAESVQCRIRRFAAVAGIPLLDQLLT
jgi:transcriptional regulator with XRE-family HTH domain